MADDVSPFAVCIAAIQNPNNHNNQQNLKRNENKGRNYEFQPLLF